MDLWDLTKLLFRRWYFSLPLLLVFVAVVGLASQQVKPDYSASGHLQLIPPPGHASSDGRVTVKNPWYDLGYAALGQAAVLDVTSKAQVEAMVAAGLTDNVTVLMDKTPLFIIEAVGTSSEQATKTVQHLQEKLAEAVTLRQAKFNVTGTDMITTLALDDGSSVEVKTSKVTRVLIVATAIGILLTVGLTVGLDALLRRKQRPRKGATSVRDWTDAEVLAVLAKRRDASTKPAEAAYVAAGATRTAAASASGRAPGGPAPRNPQVDYRVPGWDGEGDRDQAVQADETGEVVSADATIVLPLAHMRRSQDDKSDVR